MLCSVKKEEQILINKIINKTLNKIIKKDIDEQIFFNAIQDEIKLINEMCKSTIIEEEKIREAEQADFHNNKYPQIKKAVKEKVNKEQADLPYLEDFSMYEPIVVHNTVIKICDFLAEHPVYAVEPRFVCDKIKFFVGKIQIAINFKLKVFTYLENEGIISYSNERLCWYVSNKEFVKDTKNSSFHKLLEEENLLVN